MSRKIKIAAVIILIMFAPVACLLTMGGGQKASMAASCTGNSTYLDPADVNVKPNKRFDTPEQQYVFKTIAGVSANRGEPLRNAMITTLAGIAESDLRNLKYGDRDSLGYLQFRPSQGWGTAEQALDPVYVTNTFLNRLNKLDGNESMPMYLAAAKVLKPGSNAYYERIFRTYESTVRGMLADYETTASQKQGTAAVIMPAVSCSNLNDPVMIAVQAALSQQGAPYSFGQNDDGSRFTQWAWGKAGVKLPLGADAQYRFGNVIKASLPGTGTRETQLASLKPGDLIYWQGALGTTTKKFVAMYVGDGNVIASMRPGALITVQSIMWESLTLKYAGATRPPLPEAPGILRDGWGWPLKKIQVTSKFGMRFHPTKHVWMLHDGVDFVGTLGTPVYAANAGVTVRSTGTGFGNQVTIDHGGGVKTAYAHLNSYAPGMQYPGVTVKSGQLIGYVGTTGWSTGPHLHFKTIINGVPKDPLVFMRAHGLIP